MYTLRDRHRQLLIDLADVTAYNSVVFTHRGGDDLAFGDVVAVLLGLIGIPATFSVLSYVAQSAPDNEHSVFSLHVTSSGLGTLQ